MLITQLKSTEDILSLASGNTIIIRCVGCDEVYSLETEVSKMLKELSVRDTILIVTDYICSSENLELQAQRYLNKINAADTILVISCGVGVQTVAKKFIGIPVYAVCDTFSLPGNQGITPLEYDCAQCGECYLNDTGGICPITACSKSLVNGQCGGSKNGKCEVDKDMECGWERIYKRLNKLGAPYAVPDQAKLRNFASGEE